MEEEMTMGRRIYSNLYADICLPLSMSSDYVDKEKAVRLITDEYRFFLPVVDEVLQGKTTFTQEVSPLIKENLRLRWPFINGACRSKNFKEITARARDRLGRVFELWYYEGDRGTLVDLTKKHSVWRLYVWPSVPLLLSILVYWALKNEPNGWKSALFIDLFGTVPVLLYQVFSGWVWGYHRREFAARVQKKARRLDSIIRQNYKL